MEGKKTNHRKLQIISIIIAVLIIVSFILEKVSLHGFTVGYFEKDGVHTTFLDFPKEDKPTVLFLHGAGASANTYYRSLIIFAEDYHVVAPNIPIFGGASVPASVWDFRDFADYFNDFLEENDLDNIIAVGHSFGGGILANLAVQTDRIDYMILVDSAGGPLLDYELKFGDWFGESVTMELKPALDKNTEATLSTIRDFTKNFLVNSFSISHIEEIINTSLNNDYDYSNIDIPVTILWGGVDDRKGFDESLANYFDENIPNSELILTGGGHHWVVLEPERFAELVNAKIKQFLLSTSR